jgi:hypothetical protein
MERNVVELLPELRCGRFDFKGTIDRRIETDAFVQSLDLALSSGGGEGDQLSGALGQLLRAPRPTLLIFDTYESAGDAQIWIERVFFPKVLRTEWLRIVVLGQQVPPVHGELWESISTAPIQLQHPDPAAWFEYSRRLCPEADIDLDFVVRAHRLSRGKPTILATLLGP